MWAIVLRALFGGLLVTAFAVIGGIVSPKRFAGLFAAAPAVALAGMAVLYLSSGSMEVSDAAYGMIVGSVALVACCAVSVDLVPRLGAVKGSVVALIVWVAIAGVGWLLIA
ncbi:MAG: hypothetical protein JWQ95_2189 [Sphaerisporangium sp.]|jgi:hypothetical protein|nr:hypothetical protein [Sphaerisporangium sp.]